MLRRASLALVLACSLAATPALGAPRALKEAVRVEAGTCLSAPSLVQAIGVWRGTTAVAEGVTVTVSQGSGARARFVVRRGDSVLGEREIDGANASCRELSDAVALLIAVALDAAEPGAAAGGANGAAAGGAAASGNTSSEAAAGTFAAGASPGAAPAPAPAPGGTAPLPATGPLPATWPVPQRAFVARPLTIPRDFGAPDNPAAGARLGLEITGGGGVGLDVVPAGVPLVTASLGLRFGPRQGLAGVLRGGVLATGDGQFSLRSGQVQARLAAGRLDLCGLWMPSRAGLEACAGFGAGSVSAHGSGYTLDAATSVPWAAVAARVAGRLNVVGPFGLLAGVDAFVPVLAPRLQVVSTQGAVLGEAPVPPVGVGIFLAATFTFP
jgi:hypothetical protein